MGHSCRTLLWDTPVGHSCGTLFWDTLVGQDTLVGHCCGALLWDTLVGHSCRTLLWDTLVGHSCGTLLWGTLVGHSCGSLAGHSSRTLLGDCTGSPGRHLSGQTEWLWSTLLWEVARRKQYWLGAPALLQPEVLQINCGGLGGSSLDSPIPPLLQGKKPQQ